MAVDRVNLTIITGRKIQYNGLAQVKNNSIYIRKPNFVSFSPMDVLTIVSQDDIIILARGPRKRAKL